MATKINFISVSPSFIAGAATVVFFEDRVEVKNWTVPDPESQYEALFPKVVKGFVEEGANFIVTITKQTDIIRENGSVRLVELDDSKKED